MAGAERPGDMSKKQEVKLDAQGRPIEDSVGNKIRPNDAADAPVDGKPPSDLGRKIMEMPKSPSERQEALKQFSENTHVTGAVQAQIYKTPDGKSVMGFDSFDKKSGVTTTYIPRPDGQGFQEFVKNHNTLTPTDGGKPLTIGGGGRLLASDAAPPPKAQDAPAAPTGRPAEAALPPVRDNHQQTFAPPPDHGAPRGPKAPDAVPANPGDGKAIVSPATTDLNAVQKPVELAAVHPPVQSASVEQQRQQHKMEAEAWRNMTPEQRKEWREAKAQSMNAGDQAGVVKTGDAGISRPVEQPGKAPQNQDRPPLQGTVEFRNMDLQRRNDLIEKAQSNPAGPQASRFEGRVDLQLPKGQDGKVGAEVRAAAELPRGQRPADAAVAAQIDARLAQQLQAIKNTPFAEGRANLSEILSRFQEGRLVAGNKQEAALLDLFKAAKPADLNSLHAFLSDPSKAAFRIGDLDPRSQQNIAKILDNMFPNAGRDSDRSVARLLDLLGSSSRGLDKIPSGEQTKALLLELKGGRDAHSLSESLGRSPSGERASADFRLAGKDLEQVMQNLLSRLRDKDLLSTITERSSALGRMDGMTNAAAQSKDFFTQSKDAARELPAAMQLKENALSQQKDLGQKDNLPGRELAQRDESRTVSGRQLESAKDIAAIGKNLEQGILPADRVAARAEDIASQRVLSANEILQGKSDGIISAENKTLKSPEQENEESISRRKKEEDDLRNSMLIQKERLEKEEQDRKLEEERRRKLEEEDKQRRLEEEEKRKEEERKKKQDPEINYTVQENDTLYSISNKFSGPTAEHIYARNDGKIQVQEYKGKKYARVFPGQKIVIPNQQYINEFKASTRSYSHLNFDKIPFASPEEEMAAWQAGMAAAHKFIDKLEDDKPSSRRSFSGKEKDALSQEERKENVSNALGLPSKPDEQRYTVKLGQQLRSISQKLYGDPSYWRLIAQKNELSTDTDSRGEPLTHLRKGQQILLPSAEEIQEFKRSKEEKEFSSERQGIEIDPACPEQIDEQFVQAELQEVELTDANATMNFNPGDSGLRDSADSLAAEMPSGVQHPIPDAEYSKVEIGFGESDSLFEARLEPELLDQYVQVVESRMLSGDQQGLRVSLQMLNNGQWRSVYDYEIFADELYIHQHKRSGGRQTIKRSLGPAQAKEMAWNHFRKAWKNILGEFWRS
ncbi:MAG: LysM peptidoglycan-binding domain-containing protein [Candidatus Obscuribacterales bacterium]|nr:LysM peptidoglycan-binding domain-containing protein [Candidatus Obscuribacterales bacterium]